MRMAYLSEGRENNRTVNGRQWICFELLERDYVTKQEQCRRMELEAIKIKISGDAVHSRNESRIVEEILPRVVKN